MPDDLDGVLLERFVGGDRDAFEALFRRFEGDVYRWVLRIVRDSAAAEDVVVETFWRCYRSRARFEPSRSFGAWLRRIATNAAIDELKRAGVDRRLAGVTFEWPAAGRAPVTLPPDAAIADAVGRAFRALPAKLRVVATLALIEECGQAEIADALDVPIGTVKSRLFRATRQLRDELTRLGVHA